MKETYEIGPGKTVTITVQVDDARSTYDADQAAEVLAGNYARAQARIAELSVEVDTLLEECRFERARAERAEDAERWWTGAARGPYWPTPS